MKRFFALLLILSILALNLISMLSCSSPDDDGDIPEIGGNKDNESDGGDDDSGSIIEPEYKDYGKSTKRFSVYALEYARPDLAALCADFYRVADLIRENTLPFEDQIAAIEALEPGYESFYSMLATAEIFNSKDTTNEHWAAEYAALTEGAPTFSKAVEEIFVAAAGSVHRTRFEEEYFHTDISEYANGGKYTDAVVAVMTEETALENEYKSISPSTVTITFENSDISVTDTYEQVLRIISEYYGGTTSLAYLRAKMLCDGYYEKASADLAARIYTELVVCRSRLAAEMGYKSYIEMAYDSMGYEYSPEQMREFIDRVAQDVYPVYKRLYTLLFSPYFSANTAPKRSTAAIINTAGTTTAAIGEDFADIFSYMLYNELYDISPSSTVRFDVSFTTYIGQNESPYMFVTSSGYVSDFSTVTHEFGHFIDYFVNNDSLNSLELAEVCSQGFEYLSLIKLQSHASKDVYKYMKYEALANAFEVLVTQALYAEFEHSVYSTPESEISISRLEALARSAADGMFGTSDQFELSQMLIPHMFIAPMYVQSYCTSIIPALQIYLAEIENAGEGIAAYRAIIYRKESDADFLNALADAGLDSPFKSGILGELSDDIYYHLTGMRYKTEDNSGGNAA